MKKIFTATLMLCLCCVAAMAVTTAQRADSAYNKEDYREAIRLYEQSLAEDGRSSTVYYNLGNAYYRHDNVGKAVLSYERALRLNPTNADARQNLEFVKGRIQDRPEDDSSFFSNMHRGIVASCTADSWAWIAFGVFICFAGAAALYMFTNNVTLRKTGFFGGLVLLVLFIYVLCVASDASATAQSHEEAVVTVPGTQLSSAPRAARTSADKVVTIHEGTKVEIVDSVATPDDPVSPKWYEVKINNSTRAWLRSSDVERI